MNNLELYYSLIFALSPPQTKKVLPPLSNLRLLPLITKKNMSRLASFQGPSTPSKTPVQSPGTSQSQSPRSTPGGKSRKHSNNTKTPTKSTPTPKQNYDQDFWSNFVEPETELQKNLRSTLVDIRIACRTFDDLVKGEGFKAAKEMVDARTGIACVLFSSTAKTRI